MIRTDDRRMMKRTDNIQIFHNFNHDKLAKQRFIKRVQPYLGKTFIIWLSQQFWTASIKLLEERLTEAIMLKTLQ